MLPLNKCAKIIFQRFHFFSSRIQPEEGGTINRICNENSRKHRTKRDISSERMESSSIFLKGRRSTFGNTQSPVRRYIFRYNPLLPCIAETYFVCKLFEPFIIMRERWTFTRRSSHGLVAHAAPALLLRYCGMTCGKLGR